MKKLSKNIVYVFIIVVVILIIVYGTYNLTIKSMEEKYYKEHALEHPTSYESCLQMNKEIGKSFSLNFCLADVAEITNNIALCNEIKDDDIKLYCIAVISLDKEKCSLIKDSGLGKACLESIKMKNEWAANSTK